MAIPSIPELEIVPELVVVELVTAVDEVCVIAVDDVRVTVVPVFIVDVRYIPVTMAMTIIGTAAANALMFALFLFN